MISLILFIEISNVTEVVMVNGVRKFCFNTLIFLGGFTKIDITIILLVLSNFQSSKSKLFADYYNINKN